MDDDLDPSEDDSLWKHLFPVNNIVLSATRTESFEGIAFDSAVNQEKSSIKSIHSRCGWMFPD